ncbi:hypothetical protein J1605_011734 [Eschrichtius robustus]|uniref:Uncharacterized protein n=1 Tax=Eschrichtius robustus TaxID=9764 RepID=A0AB34GP15_ESCRO|nr:hypothetical protein J1605_011734 [Eschrichtius robustus]
MRKSDRSGSPAFSMVVEAKSLRPPQYAQARFQLFTPLAAILAGRAGAGRGLLPAPPPPRGQGLTPHPGLLRRLQPLTPVSFRCQVQLCSEWRKCAEEPGYAWLRGTQLSSLASGLLKKAAAEETP